MAWAQAARSAALAALRGCKSTSANAVEGVFHQQIRRMGGGHGGPPSAHRSYDGKPPPREFQGPDFITYAGLTMKKPTADADLAISKIAASVFWFTVFYHLHVNWEELWYGDIGVFERDVQRNGWDDEAGHGHGHH